VCALRGRGRPIPTQQPTDVQPGSAVREISPDWSEPVRRTPAVAQQLTVAPQTPMQQQMTVPQPQYVPLPTQARPPQLGDRTPMGELQRRPDGMPIMGAYDQERRGPQEDTREWPKDVDYWHTLKLAYAEAQQMRMADVTEQMLLDVLNAPRAAPLLPNPGLPIYNDYRVLQFFQAEPGRTSWDLGSDYTIDLRTALVAEWTENVGRTDIVRNYEIRGTALRWACRRAQHEDRTLELSRARMARIIRELDTKIAAAIPERARFLGDDRYLQP